jgi:RNA polymerase sigma-70 factor (ECF subfamily)
MTSRDKSSDRPAEERKDTLLPQAMRSAETEALIRSAQEGDAAALNDLFARYHGIMVDLAQRRLGARLRRKEEADDLAQTTFREATRDFGSYEFRGEGSFLRWLMQILQNKIRDKAEYYSATKRDIGRESSTEELLGRPGEAPSFDPAARDLSVTQTLAREEEFAILRTSLEDLSPDHRTAITLVFFQGLSLREAGERMGGRSEDAVRMLLRRAEGRLRESTRGRLKS